MRVIHCIQHENRTVFAERWMVMVPLTRKFLPRKEVCQVFYAVYLLPSTFVIIALYCIFPDFARTRTFAQHVTHNLPRNLSVDSHQIELSFAKHIQLKQI